MTAKKSPEVVEEVQTEVDVLTERTVTDRLELSNGTEVQIKRLRTREMLKLLRIFTHGAGAMLGNIDFGSEEFAEQLVAVLLIAIPDAEDEVTEFIQAMVVPLGYEEKPKTKAAKEANEALVSDLNETLDNLELDDLFDIISAIITNEGPELQSLGKKLQSILGTFQNN